MTRTTAQLWLLAAIVTCGCTAPSVTATIEGEPVCPDFELGAARTKMKGGLRKPVRVAVLEDPDDDEPLSARTLLGRRTAEAVSPKVLVQDSNDTYTVEWAQCEAVRAPRPVKGEERGAAEIAGYQCGEAKVYKKTEIKVRKGDPSSRVIHWVAPPEPACWTDTVPEEAAADAGADANADASAAASSAPAADAAPPVTQQPGAGPPGATAKPTAAPKAD